jgi:hypothetical protein
VSFNKKQYYMPEQLHTPALHSANLKTSSKTFFFDVKAAKNGNKYITITESRIKDGQKFRNTLTVFQDQLQGFAQVLQEISEKAKA